MANVSKGSRVDGSRLRKLIMMFSFNKCESIQLYLIMTTMSLNPLQDEPQSSISSTPPPWPKIPSSSRLTTEHRPLLGFEEYIGPGLRYHTSESSKGHHHQIFPQRLHMQCVTVNKSGVTGGKQQAPTSYTVNRAGLTVIRSVDAWAIGDETVEWVEPPGTKIFKHES